MCIRDSKCSNGSEINFKNNRIILPFNQLSFDELTNSDDLESVSYTHLDVYKRQI